MDGNSGKDEKTKELAERILYYFSVYESRIPQEFLMLAKKRITSMEEVLIFLMTLFTMEEKEIEKEQLSTFVTVDYENAVRNFAVSIIVLLYPEHNELRNYKSYRSLLSQKHMAYAFFHALNNDLFPHMKCDYSEFHEDLYLGLTDFYEGFYGRFRDNEEAIELLCKYFPRSMKVERHKRKIAEVLYMHVSNAGTPSDRGYAFQGIAQIEKNIGALPTEIVVGLLGRYQVYFLVNNAVSRHQVYAIIEYSSIKDQCKALWKFRLLDSVVLAQQLQPYLVKRISEEFQGEKITGKLFGENYVKEVLKVCESPNAYWSKGKLGKRYFFLKGKMIARIRLGKAGSIEIGSLEAGTDWESVEIPYSYTDWLLEDYYSKEVERKLSKLIMGTEGRYRQMFFSLLYLDGYRGMKNQVIDFDHKFRYEWTNKSLKCREGRSYQIKNFYGQQVQTLSCIVGKNGMGKTSIIDFLRESFFKMLRLIEEHGVPCEQGCIKEEDYQEYDILDKSTRFLIVFKFGKTPFFLTNINDVNYMGAEPFRRGIYNSVNEFSKVAYFSNMLRNNQEEIFFEDGDRRVNDRLLQEKREIGRNLRGFRQVDYSETESFIKRQKAIALGAEKDLKEKKEPKSGVNRELCYQLTFLESMDMEKICEYLDIDDERIFRICSRMHGRMEETFSLKELNISGNAIRLWQKYLFLPDAQLQYFSSGQYVKFAFLSKLYWFLSGYRRKMEKYRDIVGENEFRSEEALLDGETGLVFIDEGETYYHPEWQRRYVKTLLEMVSLVGEGAKLQIVITTNSPFILSDILNEDVTYLAGEEERRFERTLGQNIHRLLKENFFMDFTIGEYARKLIENIMKCLKNPDGEETDGQREAVKALVLHYYGKEKEAYPAIRLLIEQIGEPVYRYELEKLLEDSYVMKEYKSLERLLEEKRRIEEEISELEKKG